MRLHKKYHGRSGCIRRDIMAKRKVSKLKRLKAQDLPVKKPCKTKAIEVTDAGNRYNAFRQRLIEETPYRGSEDEMEHRLGMRLPKRGR